MDVRKNDGPLTITMRLVWLSALAWVAFDVICYVAGWQEIGQALHNSAHTIAFTATVQGVAYLWRD